jgi:putative transposase
MPRRPRIHLDGVPLHIVQRGHNRQPCFFANADYPYQRSGTLWEGRYKSSLVQTETYLLSCMRYIELNPVRAAMCQDPADYRWTSYRANALGEAQSWLTPHPLYASLGHDEASRLAAYRVLFDQVLSEKTVDDIRLALNQTQPLGNLRFLDAIEQATGQRREPKPWGRPRGPMKSANSADQLPLPNLE